MSQRELEVLLLVARGQPLPGTLESTTQGPSSTRVNAVVATGTTGVLAVGTYTIAMREAISGFVNNWDGDPHVSVIAYQG